MQNVRSWSHFKSFFQNKSSLGCSQSDSRNIQHVLTSNSTNVAACSVQNITLYPSNVTTKVTVVKLRIRLRLFKIKAGPSWRRRNRFGFDQSVVYSSVFKVFCGLSCLLLMRQLREMTEQDDGWWSFCPWDLPLYIYFNSVQHVMSSCYENSQEL